MERQIHLSPFSLGTNNRRPTSQKHSMTITAVSVLRHNHAAIDIVGLASDCLRRIACEEYGQGGDLLRCKALGQPKEAVLGRHIGCAVDAGNLAVNGSNVDDAAPTVSDHARKN